MFFLFSQSEIRFFRLKTRLIFYWLASIPSAQQKAVDGEKCINSVRNSSLGRFISVWIRSSSAKAWNLNPVHSSPRFNCGKFLGKCNNGKYSNWRHRSFKIISKRGCWLVKARSLEIEANMKNCGEICHMWCSSNLLSWANFSHRWSLKLENDSISIFDKFLENSASWTDKLFGIKSKWKYWNGKCRLSYLEWKHLR